MRAELQQSLDYLTPLGVTAHDNVDATALDLRLRPLAGAIWVWAPSYYYHRIFACLEISSIDQTVEDVEGCERSSAQQAF